MSQAVTIPEASAPDRLTGLVQQRVFGERIEMPLEIRFWSGRYIFAADHAFLCLHEFLKAVAKTPIEVLSVHNLYLWGAAQAFRSRNADAYRVVLERPLDA